MRSTFSGLNTMVRGVFANQLSLDTVGHNITNASTEGYSRQSVNQAATRAQEVPSLYGNVLVGSGVDAMSLQRARNVYADKQYWAETSTHEYYKAAQVNYDKLEAIFDDSDKTGVLNAMQDFYKAWNDLSVDASIDSKRVTVVGKANIFADKVKTAASQLQDQINAQYDDIRISVSTVNDINAQIVELNKNIMGAEAVGAQANDLRDQRDLLVDKLSAYMNLNVYEDDKGMYTIVSNGISMVNGINKLTLEMSDPYANKTYGLNDYSIQIKESGIAFIPQNGSMKAQLDTIAEDKTYIDKLADMSAFMLTVFNNMHQQGAGIDGTDGKLGTYTNQTTTYAGPTYGINFFGDHNTLYEWDNDKQCVVARELDATQTITHSLDMEVVKDADGNPVLDVDGNPIYRPVVKIEGTEVANSPVELDGMNIINALAINEKITAAGGTSLIAARTLAVEKEINEADGSYTGSSVPKVNGSGDGTNAVNLSHLFNIDLSNITTTATINYTSQNVPSKDIPVTKEENRPTGKISLNAFYNSVMSDLGTNAKSIDTKESAQDDLITQIVNWRSSTSGVDWNEELTNMITFQKGYSACSRCLTTMDEMLDRLINSTGVVGR
ncbi:MAG: flagellar hook-associated protein FlgK [Selenomonas ruminantium]|jgi:flagellar hook-associated protein 1 FlgK|uniref:Flagellar hook-associated protein 1 n=1 Tax=Selenomonas ruminantium TaxID=971 RepID=A0A927ZQV0_SELRU|nr:flagellar hook-associated protein FlgK [Selenomonas ruminantium]MBE6085544.1 flagellar hook-associated protein FlgK [Selenomonas ruminantium]